MFIFINFFDWAEPSVDVIHHLSWHNVADGFRSSGGVVSNICVRIELALHQNMVCYPGWVHIIDSDGDSVALEGKIPS